MNPNKEYHDLNPGHSPATRDSIIFRGLSGIGGLDYWTGILDWNSGTA